MRKTILFILLLSLGLLGSASVLADGKKTIFYNVTSDEAWAAGMTMDDVIEGVVMGGPDVTLKAMTADDTVVISY